MAAGAILVGYPDVPASAGTRLGLAHTVIGGNKADSGGGAVHMANGAHVTMSHCRVSSNYGGGSGGGLSLHSSTADLYACLIVGNRSGGAFGGGIAAYTGSVVSIDRCTIAGNVSTVRHGGVYGEGAYLYVTSTIMWDNTPRRPTPATTVATFSDIRGGWPGIGNIDADPLFVDPANGDYSLALGSPCIDAGDPDSPPDADGSRADMGAAAAGPVTTANSLWLPTVSAAPGEHVRIAVRATAHRSFGADIQFLADADVVEGLAVTKHAFMGRRGSYVDAFMVGDTIKVSLASADPVSLKDEPIVELEMLLDDEIGETDVALTWLPFPATNVNELPVQTHDGLLSIMPTRYGDVSFDGSLSSFDASMILQYQVGRIKEIDGEVADVTGNGTVSHLDAALVALKVVDPEYVFPVEGGSLPKAASVGARVISWFADGAAWNLAIDDPSGVLGGYMLIALPDGAPVSVSGGMLAGNQVGAMLSVAFVRESGTAPVLFRVEGGLPNPPRILHSELNEGLIVTRKAAAVTKLILAQNRPNPFNPNTSISFAVPFDGFVHLAIYDLHGRLVRSLLAETTAAARREVVWDGRDDQRSEVASGVYVYRLTVTPTNRDRAPSSLVRRMLLVR